MTPPEFQWFYNAGERQQVCMMKWLGCSFEQLVDEGAFVYAIASGDSPDKALVAAIESGDLANTQGPSSIVGGLSFSRIREEFYHAVQNTLLDKTRKKILESAVVRWGSHGGRIWYCRIEVTVGQRILGCEEAIHQIESDTYALDDVPDSSLWEFKDGWLVASEQGTAHPIRKRIRDLVEQRLRNILLV